ncbi:dsRBD fold-containing protein [Mycobacterium colombiense]|uniref:dsRBD fold-containing protein n=1 Tax=Mycobacterium colombiense TaxID=339268 RepID=UPI0004B2D831|nr:dsRBD fold-containing protein [Mycobacterium colombiense]
MTADDHGTKSFRIDMLIEERGEERTRAKARICWAGTDLVGIGLARLDPADQPVSRIGGELAVARALTDLANQFFAMASADIQASTHEPVTALHH